MDIRAYFGSMCSLVRIQSSRLIVNEMNKKVIKIKVESRMIRDEETGLYTIYSTIPEKGGAVVSDLDPVIAMKKFKEAMILSFSVRNLKAFSTGELWWIPVFE